MSIKLILTFRCFGFLILLLCMTIPTIGQTKAQEKMEHLSFMVGKWLGTSTSFKNDTITNQVAAFEQIGFKVEGHVMTIDLNSASLSKVYSFENKERIESKFKSEYKTTPSTDLKMHGLLICSDLGLCNVTSGYSAQKSCQNKLADRPLRSYLPFILTLFG